jgi:hypothetical protein
LRQYTVHAPSLRAQLTETAHLRCAHTRFASGQYDDAMRHFGAAGAAPLEVLALFPGLLPPALAALVARHNSRGPDETRPPAADTGTSGGGPSSSPEALAALLPFLLGTRVRLRDARISGGGGESTSQQLPWGPEDEEAAALDTAGGLLRTTTPPSTEVESINRVRTACLYDRSP